MSRSFLDRAAFAAGGLTLGLMFGLGAAAGVWFAKSDATPVANSPRSPGDLKLPEGFQLHATAAHGSETLSMATGPIDEENEAVFLLDFLTGDLSCWVLNPRVGRWGAKFSFNVAQVLETEKGKKPAYVMCTGRVAIAKGGDFKRPADSVIYVADSNTGKFCCIGIPLLPGAMAAGVPQFEKMVLIAKGEARNVEIKD